MSTIIAHQDEDVVYSTARVTMEIAHRVYALHLTAAELFQLYGKCSHLHGHGWVLFVKIKITASKMKEVATRHPSCHAMLKSILDTHVVPVFDHCNLADAISCPTMANVMVTTENAVYVIATLLKRALLEQNIPVTSLLSIQLFETQTGSVLWEPTASDLDCLHVGNYGRISYQHYQSMINKIVPPHMKIIKRVVFPLQRDTVDVILPKQQNNNASSMANWHRDDHHLASVEHPGTLLAWDLVLYGLLDTRIGMVANLSKLKELMLHVHQQTSHLLKQKEPALHEFMKLIPQTSHEYQQTLALQHTSPKIAMFLQTYVLPVFKESCSVFGIDSSYLVELHWNMVHCDGSTTKTPITLGDIIVKF